MKNLALLIDCDPYLDWQELILVVLWKTVVSDCGGSLELDYCGVCGGDNVANECEEAPSCAADEFDCLGDGTECIPASWECDMMGTLYQMEQMKLS